MGQRVRVRQGPLFGLEGILVREKAAYRVVVNVEMLARAVAVELERDLLEPVLSPRLSGSISFASDLDQRNRTSQKPLCKTAEWFAEFLTSTGPFQNLR
jgi:hypothetical protein